MKEGRERRQHDRFPAKGTLKVYTSVSSIAYSVALKDISRNGARICTTHLPQAGEKITFQILDEYGIKKYSGQGEVVWVRGRGSEKNLGFAIHFDKELGLAEEALAIKGEEMVA